MNFLNNFKLFQFKVIDSIASLVRREFSGNNSTVYHDRGIFLSKTSSYLKQIAEILDISVLILFIL